MHSQPLFRTGSFPCKKSKKRRRFPLDRSKVLKEAIHGVEEPVVTFSELATFLKCLSKSREQAGRGVTPAHLWRC